MEKGQKRIKNGSDYNQRKRYLVYSGVQSIDNENDKTISRIEEKLNEHRGLQDQKLRFLNVHLA